MNAAAGRVELLSTSRSLEHALKLGVSQSTPWDCPWLGHLERTGGSLQEACREQRCNRPLGAPAQAFSNH